MKKITIFTHGAAKENPGPAGVGVYVVDDNNEVILEFSESIGNATNDYAEFFAVVRALQTLKEKLGEKSKTLEYELKLSNETVKKQLSAEHQVTDVSLVGHFIEIYNLRVASFPNLFVTHIQSETNKEARRLVKEALDAQVLFQ